MALPIVPVQAKFVDAMGAVASTWMKFFQALVAPARVGLADGATITIDASKGSVFDVTLGGNRTIAAPTNGIDGERITLRIRQDATGSRTVTWNAVFHFGAAGSPTLSTAAGKTDILDFIYNAQNAAWECVTIGKGL